MQETDGRMAVKIEAGEKRYATILESDEPGRYLIQFEDPEKGRRAMREVKAFLAMRKD